MEQVKCAICQVVNEAGRNTCARCGAPIAVVDNKMPALSEGPAGAGGAEVMLRRGQLIANRYTVHDLIGRGGMGCIYKVKDNTLNEIVALKTLLPEYARDSVVVERFFNEARIARGLSHPHIGRVHDIGIADEVLYISMEYIEGKSLLEMLDTIPPGQRLAVDTVLRIFDELCAALEYAHQFTIHRDIKPGNVMLDTHGSVKLMDFGVSKLMANPNLTTASMVMGTPYYMSPEQLENSASVDARSDLYSVGVMLYEVLTGDIPKGMAKPVSSIAHKVPPALDPIIEKCLEPLPENRYQNAAELREAIGTIRDLFESGMDSSSLTAGGLGKRAPGPGRKAVAALLVSLIVAAASAGLWKAEDDRRQLPAAAWASEVPEESMPGSREEAGQEPFEQLTVVVERAKMSAARALRAMTVPARKEWASLILKDADTWWKGARAEADGGDVDSAVASGWRALHRYLALIVRPEGMIYVPAGQVTLDDGAGQSSTVSIEGFFIDEQEVTAREFWEFCQAGEGWRWPAFQGSNLDVPMADVTFYDAQAYAASQHPPKKLPTDAQWVLAVRDAVEGSRLRPWGGMSVRPRSPDEGESEEGAESLEGEIQDVLRMFGNRLEWTRTMSRPFPYRPGDGREDESLPTFRTPMVVHGGHFEDNLEFTFSAPAAVPFEGKLNWLGFRCVYVFPVTLEEVQALLR